MRKSEKMFSDYELSKLSPGTIINGKRVGRMEKEVLREEKSQKEETTNKETVLDVVADILHGYTVAILFVLLVACGSILAYKIIQKDAQDNTTKSDIIRTNNTTTIVTHDDEISLEDLISAAESARPDLQGNAPSGGGSNLPTDGAGECELPNPEPQPEKTTGHVGPKDDEIQVPGTSTTTTTTVTGKVAENGAHVQDRVTEVTHTDESGNVIVISREMTQNEKIGTSDLSKAKPDPACGTNNGSTNFKLPD